MAALRSRSSCWLVLGFLLIVLLAGCNADVFLAVDNGRLTLRVLAFDDDEDNNLVLVIDGDPQPLDIAIDREGDTGPVNLTVAGAPAGVEVEIQNPGILNQGRVTFQATGSAQPQQDVPITITASDGQFNDFTQLTLDLVPWPGPSP
jgi:hypothetical protein